MGFLSLFSAYAEVFLPANHSHGNPCPFLCLRRGVSCFREVKVSIHGFSLPTQRCFFPKSQRLRPVRLFSAYAEVFRAKGLDDLSSAAFLCLRRGVSQFLVPPDRVNALFSAYAEVFLINDEQQITTLSFLCLRRGVSPEASSRGHLPTFSLPTQRCFFFEVDFHFSFLLFSAYAEVFL